MKQTPFSATYAWKNMLFYSCQPNVDSQEGRGVGKGVSWVVKRMWDGLRKDGSEWWFARKAHLFPSGWSNGLVECPTSWKKISVCEVVEGSHLLDDWAEGRTTVFGSPRGGVAGLLGNVFFKAFFSLAFCCLVALSASSFR